MPTKFRPYCPGSGVVVSAGQEGWVAGQTSQENPRNPCIVLAIAWLLAASAVPASAQDDPEGIEEIVVTGQKREESLQQSDVAVTVLTEAFVDEARVRDLRRIDDLVPNVQFNETAQLSSVFVTIRGIESNPYIVNRAALYIDGIPFRELSNAVLGQVSSIEVLRGPQSTLYGANSEGGLLIINSRQPGLEPEADVRLTASAFNGDSGYHLDGFVGGPIMRENLLGSLSLKAQKEDSYITNPASLTGEPGEIRDLFLQGRLTFQPTDTLTINGAALSANIVETPGIPSRYSRANVRASREAGHELRE